MPHTRLIDVCDWEPEYYAQRDPIDIWVVHAVEANPPEEVQAIEWFLLTTLEVETAENAEPSVLIW